MGGGGGGVLGIEVKNDKITKSAFFTRLCPQGTRRVEKLP